MPVGLIEPRRLRNGSPKDREPAVNRRLLVPYLQSALRCGIALIDQQQVIARKRAFSRTIADHDDRRVIG